MTSMSTGIAYVNFSKPEEAEAAMKSMQGIQFGQHSLEISYYVR